MKNKESQKEKKPKVRKERRVFTNKRIVLIKIGAACLLFFACCLFFFQNLGMFLSDLKHYNFFPIVFFAGIILICLYIANLVGHIESKELYKADRYDLWYRIVFTITLLSLVIRSFFAPPYLNVPIPIVCLAVASGLITWLTPKIVDNDNNEF